MLGSKRRAQTPSSLKLLARSVRFDYLEAMQKHRYWHDNDPVKTHFFNALQALFPEGERFFMDSARDVRDELGKGNIPPALLEQIQLFIRQEAMHGREHDNWSAALIELGYPAMKMFDEKLKRDNAWSRKNLAPITRLAMTAASEHFTASLAHLFIYHRPDLVEKAQSPFRELLIYHALEEVEHKAVCYDLYEQAQGGYWKRASAMVFVTVDLLLRLRNRMQYLLQQDGLWDAKHRRAMRALIWGKDGIMRALAPFLLQYFRPDFHPWETDERRDLKERFREEMNHIEALQEPSADAA
ncbi:metal-dependent hydrolase [Ketobacter sp.]|uniref:metal-dependent hydrolase n=1 Tax=Ketobacter sp. TaxID=2083498 RepID=UPI000F224960|nr:metal-dependent hydrolase [Ketobacter sp.]RLT92090.1 MAG: metal-dependent hydrolase [Ketobacter sp.]